MAQIPNEIIEAAKRVRRQIASELDVKRIFIFGSYAKGTYSENSDIDLCIVADNVENEFLATFKIAPKLAAVDPRIEPIVVAEREFNELEVFGVLKEIKSYGIEIA